MNFKLIFIVVLVIISTEVFSQTLEWSSGRKIPVNDFKGKVPVGIKEEVASSTVGIKCEIISTSVWPDKINTKIYAVFYPEQSWLIKKYTSDYLLNHEQRHFDIANAFAVKLQNKVIEEIKNIADYDKKFKILFDTNSSDLSDFQEKYDTDTNHGLNALKQVEYNKIISEMIDSN
jgi:hypothetical protein